MVQLGRVVVVVGFFFGAGAIVRSAPCDLPMAEE